MSLLEEIKNRIKLLESTPVITPLIKPMDTPAMLGRTITPMIDPTKVVVLTEDNAKEIAKEIAPRLFEHVIPELKVVYMFDPNDPRAGGFTAVYRNSNLHNSCKMINMAVSHCSVGDSFCKKTGRALAVRKFAAGQYIQVPTGRYGDDVTHKFIRMMFENF